MEDLFGRKEDGMFDKPAKERGLIRGGTNMALT